MVEVLESIDEVVSTSSPKDHYKRSENRLSSEVTEFIACLKEFQTQNDQLDTSYVRRLVTNQNPNIALFGVKKIESAREEDRADLIKTCLTSTILEVALKGAQMIWYAREEDRADLIKTCLTSTILEVALKGAEMIRYARQEDRPDLINTCLSSRHRACKFKLITDIARFHTMKVYKDLVKQYCSTEEIASSRLYDHITKDRNKIGRVELPKDGSRTTVLLGQLKGKVIYRYIPVESFIAWKIAFESDIWSKNNFDYTPIEPIINFKETRDKNMRVGAGVLGMNFEDWLFYYGDDYPKQREELLKKIITIQQNLQKLGIFHGHDDAHNFVLTFEKDAEDKPDLTKLPKIYCIDFDAAVIN